MMLGLRLLLLLEGSRAVTHHTIGFLDLSLGPRVGAPSALLAARWAMDRASHNSLRQHNITFGLEVVPAPGLLGSSAGMVAAVAVGGGGEGLPPPLLPLILTGEGGGEGGLSYRLAGQGSLATSILSSLSSLLPSSAVYVVREEGGVLLPGAVDIVLREGSVREVVGRLRGREGSVVVVSLGRGRLEELAREVLEGGWRGEGVTWLLHTGLPPQSSWTQAFHNGFLLLNQAQKKQLPTQHKISDATASSGLMDLPGASPEVTSVVTAVYLLTAAASLASLHCSSLPCPSPASVGREVELLLGPPSSLELFSLQGGRARHLGSVTREQDLPSLLPARPSLPLASPSVVSRPLLATSTSLWLARTWALSLLTLATLGALVCLLILYYVATKMREGTLVGNQTMGVVLLLSLLSLFLSSLPWLLPPSPTVCALRHSAHLIALALCLGVLLVKVMQLRQMDRVGLGGNISLMNQTVSLAFMVLVQVVIIAEWFVIHRPINSVMVADQLQCDVSRDTFLLLHIYIYVLLLLNVFCSVSVFNIQKNFNEGRWISLASLCLTPIFSIWPLLHYFTPSSYHDPTMAVTIILSGTVLLATIFLPKLFTISAQSKLNMQKERDQMLGYSSHCTTLYSPSSSSSSSTSSSPFSSHQYNPHLVGSLNSKRSHQKAGPPYRSPLPLPPSPPYHPPVYSGPPVWPPPSQHNELSAKFNGLNFLADYYLGDTSLNCAREAEKRYSVFR